MIPYRIKHKATGLYYKPNLSKVGKVYGTVVIDNMNLNPKEIEYYKLCVKVHNDIVEGFRARGKLNPQDDFKYEIEFKDFKTPLQDYIDRDSKRPNPIGEEVIRNTYEKYKNILEA